jgi:hypothetical protein
MFDSVGTLLSFDGYRNPSEIQRHLAKLKGRTFK